MEHTFVGFLGIVSFLITALLFHYGVTYVFPNFSLLPDGIGYTFLEAIVLWIATIASLSVFLFICNRVGRWMDKY